MDPEKKLVENEKKRKLKFLEDYFSLCLEHGYCVDFKEAGNPDYMYDVFCVEDWPSYCSTLDNEWDAIKQELRNSI